MIRRPAVAGMFYPAGEKELTGLLNTYVDKSEKKTDALGVLSPHAGYIYSGAVAGAVFSCINITKTVIIIGPNHSGVGAAVSIMRSGRWLTPLGEVGINEKLAGAIIDSCEIIKDDISAHEAEHSVEVQLPFLQYLRKDAQIVPIVVSCAGVDACKKAGKAIAEAVRRSSEEAIVVASSDMTHYEPQQQAKDKDMKAIDAVLKLDEELLVKRIRQLDITMCGWAPCVIMMSYAKQSGGGSARLIKYQTSAEVSGDYSSVVGYAGIIITEK